MLNLASVLESHVYKGKGALEPPITMKDFIYGVIKEKQPITRGELKKLTTIPRTTLYETIVKLIIDNEVEQYTAGDKKRGRPKVYYKCIR